MDSLVLREMQLGDENAFREASKIPSDSDVVFALGYKEELSLEDYLKNLDQLKKGINLPSHFVPSTLFFAFVDGKIVGRLSVRHALNESLAIVGGHVGYLTLSPFRKRGYATEMLKQSLPYCRSLGLKEILLTCDDDNWGSIRTIESNGGVLDKEQPRVIAGSKWKRRYWIAL